MYADAAKNRLIETASAFSVPLIGGEFATYGILGGATRLGAGTLGGAIGSKALGAAGDYADSKLNTN